MCTRPGRGRARDGERQGRTFCAAGGRLSVVVSAGAGVVVLAQADRLPDDAAPAPDALCALAGLGHTSATHR